MTAVSASRRGLRCRTAVPDLSGVCRYSLAGDGTGRTRILFFNPANAERGQRHHLMVRLSYDECRLWPVLGYCVPSPGPYSDLCVAQDGTICCLYEKSQDQGVATTGETSPSPASTWSGSPPAGTAPDCGAAAMYLRSRAQVPMDTPGCQALRDGLH